MKIKIVIVLVTIIALGFGVRAAIGVYYKYKHDVALDQLMTLIPIPTRDDPQRVFDAVRAFVNDHSKYAEDEEFRSYWNNPHVMVQNMLDHARGLRREPVHLECSRRTGIVTDVLRKLGYESRRIDLYDFENLGTQHTFFEVLNTKTGRWETQDPMYDLYWRNRATHERVALTEAAGDLDQIEPCGPNSCGWDVISREKQPATDVRGKLDFMVVRTRDGERYTVYTPRVDPNKKFEYRNKQGVYCDVLAKNCRDGFIPIADRRS